MLLNTQQNRSLWDETHESELSDTEAQTIVGGQGFTQTVPQVQALFFEEDLPQKNSAIITDNIIG